MALSVLSAMLLLAGAAAAQEPAQAILRDDLYIAGNNVVVSQDVPVSLVGLPLGLIGGLAYVTLLLVSRICAGLVLGTLVWRLVRKEKQFRVD